MLFFFRFEFSFYAREKRGQFGEMNVKILMVLKSEPKPGLNYDLRTQHTTWCYFIPLDIAVIALWAFICAILMLLHYTRLLAPFLSLSFTYAFFANLLGMCSLTQS